MALRHKIRDLALTLAPGPMLEFLSWRSQRLIMRIERDNGYVDASTAFAKLHGLEVLAGPFKGLQYSKRVSDERNLIPKLLGSYEDELSPWIETIIASEYPVLLNVGSADGYYTVGLAKRSPGTKVIAFDTDVWARNATQELSDTNGTDNVKMLSRCDPNWLNRNLEAGAILLVDCEGYEEVLLDVQAVPKLRSCDVLVELHPHVVADIEEKIRSSFEGTHNIEEVASRPKFPEHYPKLESVAAELQTAIISEGRHKPQKWLFMTRKS